MSEKALKDLNTLPEAERNNETFSNGNFTKHQLENIGENLGESLRKNDAPIVENLLMTNGAAKSGPDVGLIEVEYVESEILIDVEDVDMSLKAYGDEMIDSLNPLAYGELLLQGVHDNVEIILKPAPAPAPAAATS